jgi:hypothetical protein
MVGRVQPPGDANANAPMLSTFDLGLPNIVLVDARPASHRNGIILHLRELAGEPANADMSSLHCHAKFDTIHEVDVLENDLGKSLTTLSFKPFESKFILIETKSQ